MGFLIVSILVAAATATSVYVVTASLIFACLAYVAAGVFTMGTALVIVGIPQSNPTD